MGFDMEDSAELQSWMLQTLAFVQVSNGREADDIGGIEIIKEEILGKLPATDGAYTYSDVVRRVIDYVSGTIDGMNISPDEEVTIENIGTINSWIVRTLAAVNIAKQHPFKGQDLVAEAAQNIVSRVQGNKTRLPKRADLDLLVQSTIRYAKEQLTE